MLTRMVHEKHGATHVYTNQELEQHKAMGWLEETTPIEKVPAIKKPEVVAPKRGRPRGS